MRWLVALLVLAVAVSVEAQNDKGANLLSAFEKKLNAAKAYRVNFEMKYEARKRPFSLEGDLLVAGINKLKGTAKGKHGDRPVEMTFLSDGKTQDMTVLMGKPFRSRWETSAKLGATVTGLLARMGMFPLVSEGGTLIAEISEPQPEQLQVKGFKLAAKEKLGDKEAQVAEYNLELKEQAAAPKIACKIWFDTATGLPLKRSLEIRVKGQVFFSGGESYSRWEFEPEIKEGTFRLPKDQKNNK